MRNKREYSYTHNIEKLLVVCPESLYWIGYIYADGHVSDDSVVLSSKDLESIEKLKKYLNSTGKITKASNKDGFSVGNNLYTINFTKKDTIEEIRCKFDINRNKTYNPPNYIPEKREELLALFIGYIDGDGCIRKLHKRPDCGISIQVHSSWLNWLKLIHQKIETYFSLDLAGPRINSRGYAYWTIQNSIILRELKRFALANSLPIMERKWNIIDDNFLSRNELGQIKKKKVIDLYNEDFSYREIAEKLNIKINNVRQIINRSGMSIREKNRKKTNERPKTSNYSPDIIC